MADQINVKDNGSSGKFQPHPEGQFALICVDTIDLGERVEAYPGRPKRVVHKCAVVFWSGEINPDTGEPFEVSAEFSVSMNEKASLRKFLEDWRGKSYTPEQAKEGVPLHKLCAQYALGTIEHKMSGAGRKYAKVKTIAPLPKQMKGSMEIDTAPYERAEFWGERKKAYAEEVAKFRNEQPSDDEEFAATAPDDDGVPF